ncbi:MAG: hypothetical protein ACKO2G_14210 [Verrucomicrobiales bacterium]
MKRSLRFLQLFLLLAIGAGPLRAQADAPKEEKKEKPPTRLRLLPIGDAPPHREEVVNGIRVHLPPPPGSIPPRTLAAWINPETKVQWSPQLGLLGQAVELPRELQKIPLLDGQAPANAPPWLTVNLKASGEYLAVLTRGGKEPSWSSPAVVLLPDDAVAFPAGRVFLLNLAPVEIPLQLGNEKFSLSPRSPVFRNPGAVSGLPLKATRPGSNQRQVFFHQGELLLNPGERAMVIVYAADGIQARQPFKLLVMKERAPVAAPPAAVP